MFPLRERKLIRGCQAHINAGLSCAADYRANYVTLYAPFKGKIETYFEKGGGNWTRLTRADNGDKIEFAHLSKYLVRSGIVEEGTPIAITGNTGTITDYPHKHIQIIRNRKRLDPEKYEWETLSLKQDTMLRTYNGTVYTLVAGYWIAIATSYEEFLSDFGNQSAPPMTEAQFKAFPLHKRTIK